MTGLISAGVCVHNVERRSRECIVLTVKHSDVRAALDFAGENGAEAVLLQRGGYPVFLELLRTRPVLFAALAAACLLLALLSRRVLAVRVEGCGAELAKEVASFIESEGIRCGVPLSSVDSASLSGKLLDLDPGIRFAEVRPEGVVLRIELTLGETPAQTGELPPCSIFADKDCVLLKIAAFDGRECAAVGEAVKKGSLLVDGDITPEGAEERVLVHSSAEIIGEVAYRFTVTAEPRAFEPVRSGSSVPLTRVLLFGASFDSATGFEAYEAELANEAQLGASPLPVRVQSGLAWELVLKETERDRGAMLLEAETKAAAQLMQLLPKQARMISKTTDLVWNEDGSLTAVVVVHTVEHIGILRYL